MKKTLAELRLVLDVKEKNLADALIKRNTVEKNVFKLVADEKKLTHEEHETTVAEQEEIIAGLEKEIRILRLVLAKNNVDTLVDYIEDDKKISLQEAIYLVKQYRTKLPKIKAMGEFRTSSRIVDPTSRYQQNAVDRSYEEITEATYDIKAYREKAKKIETLITKLEMAINQANYSTYVEVEGVTFND